MNKNQVCEIALVDVDGNVSEKAVGQVFAEAVNIAEKKERIGWDLGDARGNGPAKGWHVTPRLAERIGGFGVKVVTEDENGEDVVDWVIIPVGDGSTADRRTIGAVDLPLSGERVTVTAAPTLNVNEKGKRTFHLNLAFKSSNVAGGAADVEDVF